jgi:hypothetical protein
MFKNKYQTTTALALSMLLVASALIVGLAPSSYAQGVLGTKHVENDGETIIGSIELVMRKGTSGTDGDIIVKVLQDGNLVDSALIDVKDIGRYRYTDHLAGFNPVLNLTGDFDIVVLHNGVGRVFLDEASSFTISDETSVAEEDEEDNAGDGDNGAGDDGGADDGNDVEESDATLSKIRVNKVAELHVDDNVEVESIEFSARKGTSGTSGDVVVAIVEDNELLAALEIDVDNIGRMTRTDLTAAFEEPVLAEDFDVIIAHIGTGRVIANSIVVVGTTLPAEDQPDDDNTGGDDGQNDNPSTVSLTVEAEDEAGNPIEGMWIEVYEGMTTSGDPAFTGDTPETFELEPGDYVVAVADFGDNFFQRWKDSSQDRTREAHLTEDETFTAIYGSTPPPEDNPPDGPPPSSDPGSITAYAYRIPSSHWGPTFTGADAQMYFVLYNSTGWIVYSGYFDEDGNKVTGLNDGETYWIYATDCHHCHGGTHDVVFNHWEDNSTENPRALTPGMTAGAYYEYVPDTP